ncbi:hypothetical protein Hanom_Chr00s086162g01796731 [Helianthus anomalus]
MSNWYQVPVSLPNLPNRMYFRYHFGSAIHRILPSNTGVVPVPTGTEPYRTVPGIFSTGTHFWGFR